MKIGDYVRHFGDIESPLFLKLAGRVLGVNGNRVTVDGGPRRGGTFNRENLCLGVTADAVPTAIAIPVRRKPPEMGTVQ